MNKRYVIFISSDAWYSEVIKFVESIGDGSKEFVPSHCGMDVSGHFREALASGFVETNIDSYDKSKVRIFEIEVDDKHVEAGDTEFNKVWGRPYGWLALLSGAIYTLTGIETEMLIIRDANNQRCEQPEMRTTRDANNQRCEQPEMRTTRDANK